MRRPNGRITWESISITRAASCGGSLSSERHTQQHAVGMANEAAGDQYLAIAEQFKTIGVELIALSRLRDGDPAEHAAQGRAVVMQLDGDLVSRLHQELDAAYERALRPYYADVEAAPDGHHHRPQIIEHQESAYV